MKTSLQLPSELHAFPFPTLLVLADHEHAQFWVASGEELHLVRELSEPRERKSDNEGAMHSPVGPVHPQLDTKVHAEKERVRHYITEIAEAITDMLRKETVSAFALVMKADLSHQLLEVLGSNEHSKLAVAVDADVMKEHILDAVRRVVKERV